MELLSWLPDKTSIQIPALSLSGCVISDKMLSLSELQFLCLLDGYIMAVSYMPTLNKVPFFLLSPTCPPLWPRVSCSSVFPTGTESPCGSNHSLLDPHSIPPWALWGPGR